MRFRQMEVLVVVGIVAVLWQVVDQLIGGRVAGTEFISVGVGEANAFWLSMNSPYIAAS